MLQLAYKVPTSSSIISSKHQEEHHSYLINRYINSHHIRNHSINTIKREETFLTKWFSSQSKHFYTWNAMNQTEGRDAILAYTNDLINSQVTVKTVRSHLGILSRYFSYVLEHPYLKFNGTHIRLDQLYGPIDQPISEYDIPKNSYNGEQQGVPIDPELIYKFLNCLREHYLDRTFSSMSSYTNARNYTMAIIAAESGLRAAELLHLELSDLFFDSSKIQTRYAKGTRGSGKRARTTLFTRFAKDSMRFYLKNIRSYITPVDNNYVFPNKQGRPLQYSNIHKALAEMVQIANKNQFPILPHMGWHWFRRIFATRFIERFPHQLSALIELLGHTSPNTVHCYIKHSEAWMDNKIKQILEDSTSWPSIGN